MRNLDVRKILRIKQSRLVLNGCMDFKAFDRNEELNALSHGFFNLCRISHWLI